MIYLHAPLVWVTVVLFAALGLVSLRFLLRGDETLDLAARSIAPAALAAGLLALLTGVAWLRMSGGGFWRWEGRITLVLLVSLLLIGYLVIRGATDIPTQGRRHAAVYAVVGLVDLPLIELSLRWYRTNHPLEPLSEPAPTATAEVSLAAAFVVLLALWSGMVIWRMRSDTAAPLSPDLKVNPEIVR